ncbi:response regulator [Erythrobacter litoralis]|uniref:response regulator n=1 Tax=Erythrobacter litoralis TaxID=39960 RepID=UPI002435E0F2|nr:response regulator [Erythrobacter litoralis]MDG6080259.1 response regulator [Erythrobacter litoralis]
MQESNSILVVEDEPFVALDLKFACEDVGCDAVTASNCREAISAVGETAFIGAVLDVNLGRDETCDAIARTLRDHDIPFVLHTGDLDRAGEYLRGIEAPIVAKPSTASAVIARLQKLNSERST